MNTLYLLIMLLLVWFSLANNLASFAVIVSVLIVLLALVSGTNERAKEPDTTKAPAVKTQDIIYVPVVEDTEAPYLYPPSMKIRIRPDLWGMNQFEESAHALGQGFQGLLRMFKQLGKKFSLIVNGLEIFLMGLMVGLFLTSSGYGSIGIGTIILSFFIMLVDSSQGRVARKAPSVRVKGANMLEPIVIEVPKGPPYKIPKWSMMKVNPYWGANPGYEKMANSLGGMFKYAYAKTNARIKVGI